MPARIALAKQGCASSSQPEGFGSMKRGPGHLNKKPFATVPGREKSSGLLKTPKIPHLVNEFPESGMPRS